MFLVKPWKKSTNGWSIAVDAAAPLSESASVGSSMMWLTDVSNENKMFSFTTMMGSQFWDGTIQSRVPIFLTFENISEADQVALEASTLHYYYKPETGTTCEIDRFDCYPL